MKSFSRPAIELVNRLTPTVLLSIRCAPLGDSSDMMSIIDFDGEAVQLPRDQSRFVFEIYSEWAGSNRHRLRQLAILQLLGNGWGKSDISRALESDRSNITRSIKRARASLHKFARDKGYNLDPGEQGIT